MSKRRGTNARLANSKPDCDSERGDAGVNNGADKGY